MSQVEVVSLHFPMEKLPLDIIRILLFYLYETRGFNTIKGVNKRYYVICRDYENKFNIERCIFCTVPMKGKKNYGRVAKVCRLCSNVKEEYNDNKDIVLNNLWASKYVISQVDCRSDCRCTDTRG